MNIEKKPLITKDWVLVKEKLAECKRIVLIIIKFIFVKCHIHRQKAFTVALGV